MMKIEKLKKKNQLKIMEKKLKQKKKKNSRKKEKEILNEKIKIEEKCLENQSY